MQTLPTKTSNSLSLPTHLNKPVLVDKRELSLCMQTTGLQGRSGGLVVTVLASYTDDPSSISAEAYIFL